MADAFIIEESPFLEDVAGPIVIDPAVTVAPDAATGVAITVGGTLPAAAIKFADLTESGSESEDAGEASTSGGSGENGTRASPPPNCAICLSRCKRKCFTDSCLHQFCFKCLCEWSKIKPECPLCKQPFKTIIHNVRTLDDYDRYPVQTTPTPPLPEHPSLRFHIVNIRRPRYMPLVQNQAVMTSANDIDVAAESEDGIPTVEPSRVLPPVNRFEPYRMELMNFYRHDQEAGNLSSLSQLWRRYVYDRKLYALPVSDSLTGHFREWSARFYRDNPAQMHRLMPWINRDIVCLLRNSPHNVSVVMHLMHDILPMTNILGPAFRRRLSPYLGDRTSHFIHELFNFARSPYDMIGYDRVVQYSARVAEEVEVDLLDMVSPMSTNADVVEAEPPNNLAESSNEWVPVTQSRTPRPSTSVIVTNPSATHSFSVTMATDGSELPGISIRRTTTSNVGSQTVAINLSMRRPVGEIIEIDDGDAAANAEVAAINDNSNSSQNRRNAGAALPVSAHIELESTDEACSNSSDDECIFVLERKPPHLRTPEMVSLDSESDSDVVFVDEQQANQSVPATDNTNNGTGSLQIRSAENELFMGPSTSTGVCSTSGKNWKKVLEEARRQDRLKMRIRRRKRVVLRGPYAHHRCFVAGPTQAAITSDSSSSDTILWSSSSSSSSDSASDSETRKTKKRRPRKACTRKRAAQQKSKQPTNKRCKRHPSYVHDEDTSSDSTSGGSTSDSTENMQLSALRATLKAEVANTESSEPAHDRKVLKIEIQSAGAHDDDALFPPVGGTEPNISVGNPLKRRRTCSSSCLEANLTSQSSMASSISFTTSSSSALSLFNTDANDANDPLVRGSAISPHLPTSETMDHLVHNAMTSSLSTVSHQRVSAVFNDQSAGVEDAISFLRNALPNSANSLDDDAHLGLFSDTSIDYQVEPAIDVVGDISSLVPEATQSPGHGEPDDTATATEDNEDDGHNNFENDVDDDDGSVNDNDTDNDGEHAGDSA